MGQETRLPELVSAARAAPGNLGRAGEGRRKVAEGGKGGTMSPGDPAAPCAISGWGGSKRTEEAAGARAERPGQRPPGTLLTQNL